MARYDSRKTTILAKLREAAGLTQDEAAAYFGMTGEKRRDSVGAWERGTGAPHGRRRSRFIDYLWSELGLWQNPTQFSETWDEIMVGQWRWVPLRKDEIPVRHSAQSSLSPTGTSPFQAIRDIPHFVGRKREIDLLRAALTAREHERVHCLVGAGGVGKTALIAHLAHLLRPQFPSGVLWAQLDASDTGSILAAIANAYGHNVSKYPTVESKSQIVRGILADKRALLILDNAQNSRQVRPLLPPNGPCAVVVTTRHRNLSVVRSAHKLEVTPFNPESDEVFELFAQLMGRRRAATGRPQLMELAKLLGYHPLALDIAASRLAHEDDKPIDTFLRSLHQTKDRLSELQYEDLSVRASFAISYEGLPDELQVFFTYLGVFSGEDFDVKVVASIAQVSSAEANRKLALLRGRSLLQEARSGRYRLHPLLRDFARERLSDDGAYCRMAQHYYTVLARARELYEQGGEGVDHALSLFDLEWSNFRAGFEWAEAHMEDNDDAAALCSRYPRAAGFLLHLRFHPDDRVRWLTSGLRAAEKNDSRESVGGYLVELGVAYHDKGEIQKSIEYFEEASAAFERVGDRVKQCSALDKTGLSLTRLGRFSAAVEYHEKALHIAREIGDKHKEGNALGNLGVAHKNLGNYMQAITYQEQSLAIAKEMGDRYGEGTSLNDLGSAHLESKNLERAIEYLEQALEVNRAIGYQRSVADALGNLGEAYAKLGQHERAIDYFEDALLIDEQTQNPHGRAMTLNSMSNSYLKLEKAEEALAFAHQSLAVARRFGYSAAEGDALFFMSKALYQLGDRAKAHSTVKMAHKILDDIEDPAAERVRNQLAEWKQNDKN